MTALTDPSPNFGPRRGGVRPRLVVLHYTDMGSPEAALDRLCDPAAAVSAHYLVARSGQVHSLVAEPARAWHAGRGRWGACRDVNSASVGIELDNDGVAPFAAAQMAALEALLRDVTARWAIPPHGVIGHQDMAPGRKADPGPRFDWRRLAAAGLSIWPEPAEADPAGIDADLARFGYPVGDVPAADLLAAFRARFGAPSGDGPPTAAEAGRARDLARRFPVDPSPAPA